AGDHGGGEGGGYGFGRCFGFMSNGLVFEVFGWLCLLRSGDQPGLGPASHRSETQPANQTPQKNIYLPTSSQQRQ
ncbi:MAG: hypothetical protein ORN28_01695, partial [Rhodoferax sp.]|nr:hypothetical protein [Rhodoferax sp.]